MMKPKTPALNSPAKRSLSWKKSFSPDMNVSCGTDRKNTATAIAPDLPIKVVGIRPGEKLHEIMCPADDSHLTLAFDDHYVICPSIRFHDADTDYRVNRLEETGTPVPMGFEYNSGNNPHFLDVEGIRAMNVEAGA